jgi:hypothetical protein
MTTLITPDDLAKRVCSGGVLYSITLRSFGTNKKDKEASAKTRQDNNIKDQESVATYKKLFKSEVLKRLRRCDTAIYAIPRKYGAPWGDGTYFIPASRYIEMTREMKHKLAERDGIIKELADELVLAQAEAKTRLGSLYNVKDYPPVDTIISRYTYETNTAQITTPNGSMLGVFGDVATAVMNDVQESFNEQISSMVPFIRATLLDPLLHLSSVLQNPKTKLYDTNFTNVWEAAERAKGLNVALDPEIDGAVNEITYHLQIAPEACRKDKAIRAMAASDCNRIIESLGGTIPAPAADSYKEKGDDVTLQPCDHADQSPTISDEQLHELADAGDRSLDNTPEPPPDDILAKLGW